MHKGPAFGRIGKATLMDPVYLPPADRDILVDYLAEHFPAERPPVLGEERPVPVGALNAEEYIEFAMDNGLIDEAQAEVMRASQPGAQDTDERAERAD